MLLDDLEIKVLSAYSEEISSNKDPGEIIDLKKDAIGIKTKDGIIYITEVKPFGKKVMTVKDYLNGIDKNMLIGKRIK